MNEEWRKTDQSLMPAMKPLSSDEGYDIYPAHKIADGLIAEGLISLADVVENYMMVAIDGYQGVFFDRFREELDSILVDRGYSTSWIITNDLLKEEEQINKLIAPFIGGDDPIFGTRTDLDLIDFFDTNAIIAIDVDKEADIKFVIGHGASLVSREDLLIYIDLPKNELQYRARAGSITNLGASHPSDPKMMYKRSYFVDWVVLNKHKKNILRDIDIFVDGQRPDQPVWIKGEQLMDTLSEMSHNIFRVRPWFEPGAWGGTWIKNHIPELSTGVPNYAWSFELIVPENGLLIESSSLLFEISFDCLMFFDYESILGECAEKYGTEFPIRFDFLDTFDGGNLSLQCHPRPEYAKKHFGENFTQEETYYILDNRDDAKVYLGFKENINPETFRNSLLDSFNHNTSFDADNYIQKHPASKHDLFLIPYGTIHGSGKNNLVLEISSTPYIFTFKMYDWLRPDLDGKPRPLNIERGMENLFFERKGDYVRESLISKPKLIETGTDWQLWHLPTHETHLYDIHRYQFRTSIEIQTHNKCLVMNLVEGEMIMIETKNGLSQQIHYAETFVIPAAAESVKVTNMSVHEAFLISSFVK
jgi:mannose-6-phosphate isomerase class I